MGKVGQQECWMSDVPCFVGIDVAKAQLDIALRPSGERWAVPNEASGVALLVDRVQTLTPTLIVLEATGGLERAVTSALATAGLPVVVVHPRQVRDCARATGQLAENGGVGRARPGPLCRRDPSDAAPTARRPDARAARPPRASPATDRHADCGTEPPGGDKRVPHEEH